MLLEITNPGNRAIYTGVSGALSLTTAIFPLLAGGMIEIFNFSGVFLIISPLVLSSLLILRKINCVRP